MRRRQLEAVRQLLAGAQQGSPQAADCACATTEARPCGGEAPPLPWVTSKQSHTDRETERDREASRQAGKHSTQGRRILTMSGSGSGQCLRVRSKCHAKQTETAERM